MKTVVRRSSTLGFVPVIVIVQAFCLLQRGTPWLGEWDWTVDWAGGVTVVTGPLLAGCAAFEVLRWRSAATWSLLHQTPRGVFAGSMCALPVLAIGSAVHVAATAVVLVATVVAGAEPQVGAVVTIVLPIAVLGAATFIGAATAVLWRSLLSVPLAAAIVFGVTAFPGDLLLPDVFKVGGTTGSLVGLAWDWRQQAAAACVLLAVTWVSAVVMHARDSGHAGASARGMIAASVVVLVASIVVAHRAPSSRLTASDTPIRYVCKSSSGTEVCLASQTSRQLHWLAGQIGTQSEPLTAIGVRLPRRHQQVVPYRRLPAGVAPVLLDPGTINARRGDAERIPDQLVMPTLCAADTADVAPPAEVFMARSAMAAWIAVRNGLSAPSDYSIEAFGDWLEHVGPAQEQWIRTTYAQLRSCSYADVRLPASVVLP